MVYLDLCISQKKIQVMVILHTNVDELHWEQLRD